MLFFVAEKSIEKEVKKYYGRYCQSLDIASPYDTTNANIYPAKIGATAVGSAIALSTIGLPLLGAIGFTPAGVAGGEYISRLQSN